MHIGKKKNNKAIDGEKKLFEKPCVIFCSKGHFFLYFFTFTMISLVLRARCAADLFTKKIRIVKKRHLPHPLPGFNGSVRGYHLADYRYLRSPGFLRPVHG